MALAVRQSVRQQPMEIAKKLNIPLWMDHGVRDAMQDARGPLYIATPYATRLDDVATATFRAAPDDLARLGFAVAHALDPRAPVPALENWPLASEIAAALKAAKKAAGDFRCELRERGGYPGGGECCDGGAGRSQLYRSRVQYGGRGARGR
jgi:hypothetical protein